MLAIATKSDMLYNVSSQLLGVGIPLDFGKLDYDEGPYFSFLVRPLII